MINYTLRTKSLGRTVRASLIYDDVHPHWSLFVTLVVKASFFLHRKDLMKYLQQRLSNAGLPGAPKKNLSSKIITTMLPILSQKNSPGAGKLLCNSVWRPWSSGSESPHLYSIIAAIMLEAVEKQRASVFSQGCPPGWPASRSPSINQALCPGVERIDGQHCSSLIEDSS